MKQRSSSLRTQRSPRNAQGKAGIPIGRSGDRFEREADRAAEAVASGRAPAFAFSRVPVHRTQRDDKGATKTDDEKYLDAAKRVGAAFLETPPGKEIVSKAEKLGDEFISTLHGKVITGAAITGAVAALAATHKELPIGIPEIPLDQIKQGLTMKITYEGPVDKPTKVMATFSIKLGPEPTPAKKPALTDTEKFRAETARMQKEMFDFKQGLKTAEQRAAEDRAIHAIVASKMRLPLAPRPSPPSSGITGVQMGTAPTSSTRAPGSTSSGAPTPPEMKLTGESDTQSDLPEKEEESPLRRKASGESDLSTAPPVVDAVLGSHGTPLDDSTRNFMESRFGFDFSKVRVHTGTMAADSARSINAIAYTFGHDVVFAGGAFSPNTFEGKRLLAHELAHIVQQENVPEVSDSASVGVRQLQRKKDSGTEPDPLAKALKGDDDDVRDLTKHATWKAIELTAADAAKLIIELLKGATLDDDEQAGLEILRKMIPKDLLDPTLEALSTSQRLGQLLDDYHGSEYRDLLELLSKQVKKANIKALLLDEFISMWWLNAAEERAVVVMIEQSPAADRIGLLNDKGRVDELRGDIANKSLALRFEAAVAETGEKRWEVLSSKLSAIFTIDASASVLSGKRTTKEAEDLLKKAAADLAAELLDYKKRIGDAQKKPDAKPGDVAAVNKEFKKRLDKLIEDKKAEFGLELRYNVEFNRLLEVAWGRTWFQDDLKEIDQILQKIPYDILHLNLSLGAFARSLPDPEESRVAGVAERDKHRIQLRGDLTLSTTAHEIGHFIHYSNAALFQDFQKLSEWSYFDRPGLAKLVPDNDERGKLEKALDAEYDKGQTDKNYHGEDHELGNYVYRYARYGSAGDYVRHHKKATFIRNYASTEPQDDFAESFAYMFTDPEALQKQCPEKYEFMLVRVLTDYRLSEEKTKVLEQFRVASHFSSMDGWDLETDIRAKYLTPMEKSLEQALDKQRTEQVDLAQKSRKAKPKAIPLDTGVAVLAQPVLERARRMAAAAKPVADTFGDIRHRMVQMSVFELPDSDQDAFGEFYKDLGDRLRAELMSLFDPIAARILLGEDVKVPYLPELAAIKARYDKSLDVVVPYLPLMKEALIERSRLINHLFGILKKIPVSPRRDRIRIKMAKLVNTDFKADMDKWRENVFTLVRDGKPFDKKKAKSTSSMLATYKKALTKVAKETK
ncbi:MAG: DUF4157 domain-containing protein [Acidobacteriota bacterium]